MSGASALDRFVQAQAPVYGRVCDELRHGRKASHWMWFVFPQLRGLGSSPTAQHYGIASRAEAEAYLAHPVLGKRLLECARLMLAIPGRTANQVLGYPDDLKLQSCMTLFHAVSGTPAFQEVLDRFYDGQPDRKTLDLLSAD